MESSNRNGTIFSQLNSEHQKISEFLVYFEKLNWKIFQGKIPKSATMEKAFHFIKIYIQNFHHSKEEDILFPAAFASGNMKNGGPECSKFFGLYLDRQFSKKFEDSKEQYHIAPHQHSPISQKIIDAGSPLAIPIDEHQSAHYAIESLKRIWQSIDNGQTDQTKAFSRIARWYIEMLKQHIQKEEDCLFVALKINLSKEIIQDLTRNSDKVNDSFKDQLAQVEESLNFLKIVTEESSEI